MPETYQKVVINRFGGPEVLEVTEVEGLPEPQPHEVRVKVLTAGVGFTDTIVREGQYYDVKEKPPLTPGYDWFGVVHKVGSAVDSVKVGQFVADMSVIGGYTQYLCVAADRVVVAPQGIDAAQAVSMILSYTTAFQMITRIRSLNPGATCLVHAAGGAVGTALLDLGRHFGLTMYATASSAKHDAVRAKGATPIDYRSQDFLQVVKQMTNNTGVDIVFDTIGGKNWSRSYRCVKRGGILVAFGALQMTTGEESLPQLFAGFFKLFAGWKLLPDGRATTFYNIQRRRETHPEEFKEDVQQLFELLMSKKIEPVIESIQPLAAVADVHRRVDSGEVVGKVVLRCNDSI